MVYFLNQDEMFASAPGIFAQSPSSNLSDRYSFISSKEIIGKFEEHGWGAVKVSQPRSYKKSPYNKKHIVRFQSHDDSLSIPDPRDRNKLVFPQIVLMNSSDGTTSLKMFAGLFAVVCSNGLMVQTLDLGSFAQRHSNLSFDMVGNAIDNLSHIVPTISNNIESMRNLSLSDSQKLVIADAGKNARWGSDSEVDSRSLLNTRRQEDSGDDLWTVFNRVQENTIRGGFKGQGQKRMARELSNIDALSRVNLSLWEAAESILQAA